MNSNISIKEKESITITNPTWGDISVSLDSNGVYSIKGLSSARFTIVEKHIGSNIEEYVVVENNSKDEVKKPKSGIQQTAFSNLNIDGDFSVNVTQSIRF